MSKNKLTKAEALKLIPVVVDTEATAEEHKAFMNFIADHPDVRSKYESMKKLKSFVHENCPRAKAPKTLNNFVRTVSQSAKENTGAIQPNIEDDTDVHNANKSESSGNKVGGKIVPYLISAAAAVFVIIAGWQIFNTDSAQKPTYNIEQYAYRHFKKHHGQFVKPTVQTASLKQAEQQIASDFEISMHVPQLDKASFKGVVYSNFVPDYKAPMLEYHIESSDTFVYIFAFNTKSLSGFKQLVRDQNAVKKCQKSTDFHVKTVNEKSVVSWVWDGIWYTAISDHDGKTLASLVKPLHYSKNADR